MGVLGVAWVACDHWKCQKVVQLHIEYDPKFQTGNSITAQCAAAGWQLYPNTENSGLIAYCPDHIFKLHIAEEPE